MEKLGDGRVQDDTVWGRFFTWGKVPSFRTPGSIDAYPAVELLGYGHAPLRAPHYLNNLNCRPEEARDERLHKALFLG